MKASDIRKKWLDFFAEKGHHIEPSASLVPHNDPSLLWINAGMAPLKPFFDGRMKPDNPRIANSQKCIRTNDIENVGKTRRHHTFFEMLGNFSIGDYFKKEAIHWAWEFLTDPQWIGFDQDRLYVTIHPDDDEAYAIWHEDVGLPADHIGKLEENFWDLGGGPCGPCSEIFYDRGEAYGVLDNDPEMFPGGENERYLEIWNLVFTQFNHNQDGSLTPLPNKNIDTGAGLERLASVLQEVDSNFDTDLFLPIIRETAQLAEVTYGDREEVDTALKVIADHIRTGVFAIGDGVLPSNEGRGYVIRRLLRRAVRYGKVLGIHEPFMHRLVNVVGQIMGVYYAEVVDKRELIEQVIRTEEERFHETLGEGLMILEQICADVKQRGARKISGEESFKLYDTYGFPLDLTEDYAAEVGLGIDHAGFEQAMEEQRNRARAARQDDGSMNVQSETLSKLQVTSEFVGYTEWITESSVVSLLKDGEIISQCDEGQTCQVILDRTPFYAQSGGQVSDCGTIRSPRMLAEVTEVNKAPNGQHVHTVTIQEGTLHQDDVITAEIVRETREEIIKNHTATHLLHQALKDVLGDHVNQAGSLVAPDRLRFDFSHFNAITDEQLMQLEQQVNQQIWLNTPLNIELKPLEEAKQMGAMALFGEKYGEIVRIVQIGEYSLELCGGCHVEQTGQIGQFKIVSEAGIGSGVRRIEAITGKHAYEYMEDKARLLNQVADQLKTTTDDLPKRMDSLLEQLKELERENESLRNKLGRIEASSLINQVEEINGIQVLTAQLDGMNMDGLRNIVDEMKERLGSAIIVVGAAVGNKVQLVAAVTPDLVKRSFHAGKLIKEAAQICGGGGGGRPDMAQAGGNEPAKLKEALAYVKSLLK